MWPWTDDPILQIYKFTNVYRELDRGTVWLRENFREPYADHPELFFNIASYRRYNYWPAAEVIGYVEDYEKQGPDIVKRLRKRKAEGGQIFTGAHMLNSIPGLDKITHVFEIVLPEVWKSREIIEPKGFDNLRTSFTRMMTMDGYGPFIAYEVVTDLRWTRYLEHADDIMTWANPGPGAKRGVQRLMGLAVSNDYTLSKKAPKEARALYPKYPEGYLKIMQYLLGISPDYLPEWMPALEMREIEHSLCEWDKYERVRNGEGRPRAKFTPPELRQV